MYCRSCFHVTHPAVICVNVSGFIGLQSISPIDGPGSHVGSWYTPRTSAACVL